ncbi:MAG: hypothetical protein AAF628_03195 [Planctomycetota bacterium]
MSEIHTQHRLLSPAVAVFLFVAGSLPAQVFIVDEAGGPGAQFTDLPAAIDAVPDGATLRVRAGDYSPFSIDGKGIAVVGEVAGEVRISKFGPAQVIENTGAGQMVLLKNLSIAPTSGLGALLIVANCRGPVLVENLDTTVTVAAATFVVHTCDNVQLHRCQLTDLGFASRPRLLAIDSGLHLRDTDLRGPTSGVGTIGALPANPALELVRTRAIAVRSSLTGGRGGLCCLRGGSASTPGGVGVLVSDSSELIALRTTATGGRGADEYTSQFGGFIPASAGGIGIVVSDNATARFEGDEPRGGVPGIGGETFGAPSVLRSGGTIAIDPESEPSAGDLQGTPVRGQTVRFTLDAAPASVAVLLLSTSQAQMVPIEPLALGSVLFPIALAIPTASVPATGVLEIDYTIPASRQLGVTTFGQFASLHPTRQRIWLTNPFALHVNQ